jgi:hypothetical protein
VKREELSELHYITPIENIRSIMEEGMLSNRRSRGIAHRSVAMAEIQNIRATKRVPGGHPLHEYVNLYICARNPMMYRRQEIHRDLCVLRVSLDVLELPNVAVVDRNASSNWARFGGRLESLPGLEHGVVFAESWIHEDDRETWRHKSIKCAEVLVPDTIDPGYILGAYVSCDQSLRTLREIAPGLPITVDPYLFFVRGRA